MREFYKKYLKKKKTHFLENIIAETNREYKWLLDNSNSCSNWLNNIQIITNLIS